MPYSHAVLMTSLALAGTCMARGPSTTDAWNDRPGTGVLANTTLEVCDNGTTFNIRDMFGARLSSCNPGEVVFSDSNGNEGTVDSVEWQIPQDLTIASFSVFRYDDTQFITGCRCEARAFNRIRLEAFEPVYGVWVEIFDRTLGVFPSLDLLNAPLMPVAASKFRAFFTRAKNINNGGGVRVVELDGFTDCMGFSLQPVPQTVCRGQDAKFAITVDRAVDPAVFRCQWRKNGIDVSSATNATALTPQLVIHDASAADAGEYSFAVTVECGTTISSSVLLTVCVSDFNCDGFVDFTDFDLFVEAFESGATQTDVNADGFLDFTDFDAFVAALSTGC